MRCDSCPVRVGLACVGETHSPVCRDVEAGMPGRAAQLVAIAESKAPGLRARFRDLVGSIRRWIADRGRLAPAGVRAERRASCFSCRHLDKTRDTCNICGCVLMDLKRSWADSRCPLDPPRWDAV